MVKSILYLCLEGDDSMGEQEKANVSRQKTRDRISSPDQLTDYLRVTNPGIWVLLASIVLFLAGVFVWFTIGTLESTAAVKVSVAGQQATVIPREAAVLTEGMPLRVASDEYTLDNVGTDEYDRSFGNAVVKLPDGVYDGIVVTAQTHLISFLLESR